jgi:lincosamide nucleotidyltransferase A/C/D/E
MRSTDVVSFYDEMERLGIEIWVNGGWGVDALMGMQTRSHEDLDILIQQKDVPGLLDYLKAQGYQEIKLDIRRPHNFVYSDGFRKEIDVHVIVIDGNGSFIYGEGATAEVFTPDVFSGRGYINERAVKCITPEWSVKWHTGYTPRDRDFLDVTGLCERYDIGLPEEYLR